jgi:hypothetical protein
VRPGVDRNVAAVVECSEHAVRVVLDVAANHEVRGLVRDLIAREVRIQLWRRV